jgi:hypothetical protein
MKARAAAPRIADTRTMRRFPRLRTSRGTACTTVVRPLSPAGSVPGSWAPVGGTSRRRAAGSEAGGAGPDPARATARSREAKYKAKAAIDTFFTRTGDVVSAGVVALGQVTAVSVPVFAGINVALTGVWLWVAGQIAKEHRKKTV